MRELYRNLALLGQLDSLYLEREMHWPVSRENVSMQREECRLHPFK